MSRATAPRPTTRDPYGIGPVGSWLPPVLSIVGLLIVAFLTLSLLNNNIPFVGGSSGNGNGTANGNGNGTTPGGPVKTATPSNVVIVPEVITFAGSIVYAKDGNIWVQTGKEAHQLTNVPCSADAATETCDSMPSWSPDGTYVYFVRTTGDIGIWPSQGSDRRYAMTVPVIARIKADGSAPAELVLSGAVRKNGDQWFSWIRQPVLSPDGRTLAMVSDRPDPTKSDVVLQLYDINSKKSSVPDVSEIAPLGHQDPAWRPDGLALLYVRNGRSGARGAPAIFRWDMRLHRATTLTGPGYLEPSWSPDARYIAATKTSAFGNDVVILDASGGRELARITNDGASWAPTWSPTGDSIAYLHIDGQVVDLKLVKLGGAAPNWTIADPIDLTENAGLDSASRPDWYVPASELPAPPPTPTPSATASPGSSGSTAP